MRRGLWLGVVLLCWTSPAAAQIVGGTTITLTTEGWCAPATANVTGNVTITCHGVDPRALARLNELLDKKDLELQDKVREANQWAQKYQDLSARLQGQGDHDALARAAKELLHQGRLEEAGAIIDQVLTRDEQNVDRAAQNHFDRAEIYALQFRSLEAFPHYEAAHRYRPENIAYRFFFAAALTEQKQFEKAFSLYAEVVDQLRALVANGSDSDFHQLLLLGALASISEIYHAAHRLDDALATGEEALVILRALVVRNPDFLQPLLASALNTLGVIYTDAHRLSEAESHLKEAVMVARTLVARGHPKADRPSLAGYLNNLGSLYQKVERLDEAEGAYIEAVEILRALAADKIGAHSPSLATVLSNLGNLYFLDLGRPGDAEAAYNEAVSIQRALVARNPDAHRPDLARSLSHLGGLYRRTERPNDAEALIQDGEALIQEAVAIRRGLVAHAPVVYWRDLAESLEELGLLYLDTDRFGDAEAAYEEAVAIWRAFVAGNPADEFELAGALNNLGIIHRKTRRDDRAEAAFQEAVAIQRAFADVDPEVHAPDLARFLNNLGDLYRDRERVDEADAVHREAQALRRD